MNNQILKVTVLVACAYIAYALGTVADDLTLLAQALKELPQGGVSRRGGPPEPPPPPGTPAARLVVAPSTPAAIPVADQSALMAAIRQSAAGLKPIRLAAPVAPTSSAIQEGRATLKRTSPTGDETPVPGKPSVDIAAAAASAGAARAGKEIKETPKIDYAAIVKPIIVGIPGKPSVSKNVGYQKLRAAADKYFIKLKGDVYNKNFITLKKLDQENWVSTIQELEQLIGKADDFIKDAAVPFLLTLNPLLINDIKDLYINASGNMQQLVLKTYDAIIQDIRFYISNNMLPDDECLNVCDALGYPALVEFYELASASDLAPKKAALIILLKDAQSNTELKSFIVALNTCIGDIEEYISTIEVRQAGETCTLRCGGKYRPFIIDIARLAAAMSGTHKAGKCGSALSGDAQNLTKMFEDFDAFINSLKGGCTTCQTHDFNGSFIVLLNKEPDRRKWADTTEETKQKLIKDYTEAYKQLDNNIIIIKEFITKALTTYKDNSEVMSKLKKALKQIEFIAEAKKSLFDKYPAGTDPLRKYGYVASFTELHDLMARMSVR